MMLSEKMLLEMFSIFCMFLVVYGFKLEIWKGSRTTEHVIIFSGAMALIYPYINIKTFLGIVTVGLSYLFYNAVRRKKYYKIEKRRFE